MAGNHMLNVSVGIVAKLRVPYAHTSLEFVRIRYGNGGHMVFIFLNLLNNVFGCSAMVLTASQLVTGITGMHIVAATVLIPAGVVIYTAVGGLKATFLTDFLHSAIALAIMICLTLRVLTNEHVGGLGRLYDRLRAHEERVHVAGNYQGSLLTVQSRQAAIFGVVLKVCNLALVTMDTAFWQKSFASDVRSTVPGYDLASAAIIAVPWGIGTVMGLAARAIEHTPVFVTYPAVMTTAQVNAGLVMPFVVQSLFGRSAVVAILVLIFMDITSTVSSSLIAVSSIVSFDFYKTYVNRNATDGQILRVSHAGVIGYGFVIVGWTLAMNYAGANGNWILYFLPVTTSSGIFPVIFTLLWSRQTRAAAIISPLVGLGAGIAVWLSLSQRMFGAVNIATTSEQMPALYGALTSLFTPAMLSVAISYVWPQTFDWREFLRIELIEDKASSNSNSNSSSSRKRRRSGGGEDGEEEAGEAKTRCRTSSGSSGKEKPSNTSGKEKPSNTSGKEKPSNTSGKEKPSNTSGKEKPSNTSEKEASSSISEDASSMPAHPFSAATLLHIHKYLRVAVAFLILNILVTIIVWPLPLYRNYIFSRTFFQSWVAVSILWQFFALFAVVIYPLFDGRAAIAKGVGGMWRDLGVKKRV